MRRQVLPSDVTERELAEAFSSSPGFAADLVQQCRRFRAVLQATDAPMHAAPGGAADNVWPALLPYFPVGLALKGRICKIFLLTTGFVFFGITPLVPVEQISFFPSLPALASALASVQCCRPVTPPCMPRQMAVLTMCGPHCRNTF